MKKGYIYRLSGGNKFYIGSTTLTPEQRLEEHKRFSVKPISHKQPVYQHFTSIGWENVTLNTIRECEFRTKRELLQYEREEYDKVSIDPDCLNVNRPLITCEELRQQVQENTAKWHQENKDYCRVKLQEWRLNNPDKVKEQRARRITKSREEQREWYQQNKEKKAEQVRKWREEHPEQYVEQKKLSAQRQTAKRRQERAMKNNL